MEKITQSCIRWTTRTHCHWAEESIATTIAEEEDARVLETEPGAWVPAKAAMQWPLQWDPKDIEADFAKMHQLGYSIVRFDMLWAWFEPRPGDYNPEAFQQLDYLVSLAHKYQIYLHPSLFIGGEVGEAYWDVPWRLGRHPHADADMLRLETNLAAEFGRRYANETAIIGWDLTDEPPFWIVAAHTTDAMAINWTHLIVDGIRQHDKLHPIVVGTSGEEITHGPFRADNIVPFVNFFSVHPSHSMRQICSRMLCYPHAAPMARLLK